MAYDKDSQTHPRKPEIKWLSFWIVDALPSMLLVVVGSISSLSSLTMFSNVSVGSNTIYQMFNIMLGFAVENRLHLLNFLLGILSRVDPVEVIAPLLWMNSKVVFMTLDKVRVVIVHLMCFRVGSPFCSSIGVPKL